jgi:type 1 glutamine amidotransferase
MKKVLRMFLWVVLAFLVAGGGFMAVFSYKIKNGFPVSYETEVPALTIPADRPAVLLFSKSTGYRHSGSIEASKPVIAALAKKNGWFLYETEEGGVFNPEQLAKFSAVIFNNSTGEVINEVQKRALENYVENGGSLMGIHGSGDNSHHWDWYTQNLLGAEFSHHPLNPQIQQTAVLADSEADSLLTAQIPSAWNHADEWYVFLENPRKKGFSIVYAINGESIRPSGNLSFLITDKNFGMGKDHPVAWYRQIGKGKTFYTSMGHDEAVWKDAHFVQLIENAILWSQHK